MCACSDATGFICQGFTFPLDAFLGFQPTIGSTSQLQYAILYLAPGDYHRVHSPAEWSVTHRQVMPSPSLLPIRWAPARAVAANSRIVLSGHWPHGLMAVAAVGAAGVGSIHVTAEPVRTANATSRSLALALNPVPRCSC